jgi:hypothetical protein
MTEHKLDFPHSAIHILQVCCHRTHISQCLGATQMWMILHLVDVLQGKHNLGS